MPNYRRYPINNRPVFITLVTAARAPLLLDHMQEFQAALSYVEGRHPFRIPAFSILPDHCHFIMELPAGDDEFSTRITLIKAVFSRSVPDFAVPSRGRQRRRERGVWQRRFWEHTVRDEADLQRHFDYIHYNPVKHGYVLKPGDWPHSSFPRYVREGVYPVGWGRDARPPGIAIEMAGE